jgi:methylglutaconyl-CoA hydratase
MADVDAGVPDLGTDTGVRIEVAGAILRVTLDSPGTHNAVTPGACRLIIDAMQRFADAPEAAAVILGGQGGDFTSGAHLSIMSSEGGPAGSAEGATIVSFMLAVLKCPLPVVTKVRGYALGLGVALAGASMLSLASDTATFGLPEINHGFFPAGLLPFLAHTASLREAFGWALSGRRFGAEEAHRVGLVHAVVPDPELDGRVEALAQAWSETDREALRAAASTRQVLIGADRVVPLLKELGIAGPF